VSVAGLTKLVRTPRFAQRNNSIDYRCELARFRPVRIAALQLLTLGHRLLGTLQLGKRAVLCAQRGINLSNLCQWCAGTKGCQRDDQKEERLFF
jgi:hypothetical protein